MRCRLAKCYRSATLAAAIGLVALACEGSDSDVLGPKERDALSRLVVVGTSLSMGTQAAGVVYSSQAEAWPSLLAHQAGADFTYPAFRTPGCSPPLIAPLKLARYLSGGSTTVTDASCAGTFSVLVPPLDNVALPDATAWTALNLTPKLVAATPLKYGEGDRQRYPLVLGATQSQVTAMLVLGPTFVAVELGFEEVLRAATSGQLTPATSYTQEAAFTYVPASLFAPVYTAIADSVKRSRARAVLLGVPRVTDLPSWRTGDELWADREELALGGVQLAGDCQGSTNLLFTPSLIPARVTNAQATLTPQPLDCADVQGVTDYILTPADVATLRQAVDQMNTLIKQIADQNGWAFVDAAAVFGSLGSGRTPYSLSSHLGCPSPYGRYLSIDGVHPNGAGQQLIANAVAAAVNVKYGFALPVVPVPAAAAAQSCSL